ncbi:MAG: hypothetical protein QXZ68_06540 [Candidatus Bathyarchaeia archaeon]
MVNIDELINAITSKNPWVSRETILERLEEERRRSGGLISDDVLLKIVAAEFGVKLADTVHVPSITIGSLVPGLSDVSVAGRVIAAYPSRGLDETARSRFASLLVADKSGVIRVVLWGDKAELVDSGRIRAGHVARFSHGYTREGLWGNVELHIGDRGEVGILEAAEAEGYPTITELSTKVGEITPRLKNKRVNIIGRIAEITHVTDKVVRFVLADETGEIEVAACNEKVDDVKKFLKMGANLQLVNVKVKRASDGRMEAHVDRQTYIDVLTQPKKEFWKIAELKEGMKNINVQGTLATKPLKRKVKTAKGETVNLSVFEIKDETGTIWVSAWRKNAEKTANLKPGQKIIIKKADVRKGFADQLEIATKSTTIIVQPQEDA